MPRADLAPIGQAEANPFSAEAYDSTAMPSVHQMAFCTALRQLAADGSNNASGGSNERERS
jgi:hypothetical protein